MKKSPLILLCILFCFIMTGCPDPGTAAGEVPSVPVSDTYTVTFEFDNVSTNQTQTVNKGDCVNRPSTDPEKSGYLFDCWHKDNQPYDFTLPVMSDMTLTAHYSALAQANSPSIKRTYGMNQYLIQLPSDGWRYDSPEIRYTLDGSDPTASSPLFESNLNIEYSTTIKARTFAVDRAPSDVASFAAIPKPGYIFYDCDADNGAGTNDGFESSECGWRYLVAAEADLPEKLVYGYYRTSPDGINLWASGRDGLDTGGTDSTISYVGYGYQNTQRLYNAMGDSTYSEQSGSAMTTATAVNGALAYSVTKYGTTYQDWFLPSLEEMKMMDSRLQDRQMGDFKSGDYYWTSCEPIGFGNCNSAVVFRFYPEGGNLIQRSSSYWVRPVMRFMD